MNFDVWSYSDDHQSGLRQKQDLWPFLAFDSIVKMTTPYWVIEELRSGHFGSVKECSYFKKFIDGLTGWTLMYDHSDDHQSELRQSLQVSRCSAKFDAKLPYLPVDEQKCITQASFTLD